MTKHGAWLIAFLAAGCSSDPAVSPKIATTATTTEAAPAACSLERHGETSLLICRTHDALLVAATRDGGAPMHVTRVSL